MTNIIQGVDPCSQYVRNVVWCIANLVRGKPLPKVVEMQAIIPVISHVLQQTNVNETIIDCLWALSYCSDAGADTIPIIMETGVTP